MKEQTLSEFLAERNHALETMDFSWARSNIGRQDAPDAVLEISLHKARYECTQIPAALRHQSGEWLRERGYSRICGDLLPKGELPA